ncbi:Dabb family protein [Yoonia sp. 2307UL14-13]|uniref:Dabb family protein n=1 Tax=Yoonia sp. 2307UL14-13 TaxID=3126506 RepID=UPI0030A43FD0
MSDRPTIRHVVFFSARDRSDIPRIVAGLEVLADIPAARHFEVRRNLGSDPISPDMDVVVYAEFDSIADLEAYRAHPLYQKSIDIVRPLRDQRIAVDF